MGATGGVPPLHITDSVVLRQIVPLLRGAQTLSGLIVAAGDGVALSVSGAKIPLANGAALEPGQAVDVTLRMVDGKHQLLVSPKTLPADAPARAASTGPSAIVASVLRELGLNPDKNLPAAAKILGPDLSTTPAWARTILQLFVTRGTAAVDWATIIRLTSRAAGAGVFSPESAAQLESLVHQSTVDSETAIEAVLKRLVRDATRPLEAKLARILTGGGTVANSELADDLRAVLGQLRADRNLVSFLRASGAFGEFQDAVDRAESRLTGAHLQNLAGLDHTYIYLDVPVVLEGFVDSIAIHYFGDDNDAGNGHDDGEGSLVLDLSMTRLGEVWVALQYQGDRCACRFKADRPGVVDAIRSAAPELERALERTGFASATVRAETWDGDRFRETGEILRRYAGLDVSA